VSAQTLADWVAMCEDKEKFVVSESKHRLALAKVLLLCADIGIISETMPVYVPWLKRLYDEESLNDKDLTIAGYVTGVRACVCVCMCVLAFVCCLVLGNTCVHTVNLQRTRL
jgi:hypothetical protein